MSAQASARPRIIALGIVAVAMAWAFGPNVARAEQPPPAERVPGFDISWPQCPERKYPPGPVAFAVIGLNAGKPYTSNECFGEQYRWAQRLSRNPAVYLNVDFPKEGRREALDGPYGRCAETDDWCRAYNWGYGIGRDAAARASASRVTPSMWWLDVEVGNYWSSDKAMNAQVVRGLVDYMKENRLPAGIYGTPFQWQLITGGGYNPKLSIWTAGAQGIEQAVQRCNDSYAFGGGQVQMVQYETHGFDSNYICPGTELHLSQLMSAHTFGPKGPASRGSSVATAASSETGLRFWLVIPGLSN